MNGPDEDIDILDEMLWPQLPLFSQRVATLEHGQLTYGIIVGVAQTASRQLLYVVEYDDGDIMHLEESQAIAAKALALANTRTITPPLRSRVETRC